MNEKTLDALATIAKEILSINEMLKKASIDVSNIGDYDILDDVNRLAEDVDVVKTLLGYFKEEDIRLALANSELSFDAMTDIDDVLDLLKTEPFKSL